MIFVKSSIASYISVQKSSKNFIWCQIDRRLSHSENHIYVCGAYIPSINSKYFSSGIFEELENDIAEFRSRPGMQFCYQVILIRAQGNMKTIFLLTRTISMTILWKIHQYLNRGIFMIMFLTTTVKTFYKYVKTLIFAF